MFDELFSQGGLSLDRLKSFLEMAEAGSIAKAAPGDINRQSLISRQLRELEEFFGTELTVRRGKSLALSSAGRRLAVLVREQFRDLSDFQKEQHGDTRSFRIGAGGSLLEWLMVPVAAQIRQALGEASLSMGSARSLDVVEGVRDGRIDFGIVREDAVPENRPKTRLAKVQFHLCASETLLNGKPSRILDEPTFWDRLPFVAGDGRGQFDLRLRAAMLEACGAFSPVFECDSLLQVREMIVQGLAAGVLPSIGIKGLPDQGVVVREFAPLKTYGRHQVLHWNERQMRRRGVDVAAIRAVAVALKSSQNPISPSNHP